MQRGKNQENDATYQAESAGLQHKNTRVQTDVDKNRYMTNS